MNKAHIVGILNTTPDSYFDGGKYDAAESAVAKALEMHRQGADIIEIGGQSTGPGSGGITVEEEISRAIPIIKAIREAIPEAKLSIDTFVAEVAKEAIVAGVCMVNDVTAGRGDENFFRTVAEAGVPIVLMYAKDSTARTTVESVQYEDVIADIRSFLIERIEKAVHAGISPSNIIIDPGMGHFISADPAYSFEVIRRLSELKTLAPIFVSPSRKSFLAGPENLPPADRLPATLTASVACANNGAQYIRTHDVQDMYRALQANAAIYQYQ